MLTKQFSVHETCVLAYFIYRSYNIVHTNYDQNTHHSSKFQKKITPLSPKEAFRPFFNWKNCTDSVKRGRSTFPITLLNLLFQSSTKTYGGKILTLNLALTIFHPLISHHVNKTSNYQIYICKRSSTTSVLFVTSTTLWHKDS